MKTNKRNIAFALCVVSLLGLSGCGSSGGGGGSGKIRLSIGFWPQSSDRTDVGMYNEWKSAFEEDNPEYEIVGEPYIYSKETIGPKHASHTLPMVYQTWFTEPETLKNSGYIRDITAILNEFGWTDKIDDEMRETLTFDNKIYGIPRDGYGLGLLINTRILGDCGLLPEKNGKYVLYNDDGSPAYPTTFEEIYEASVEICDQTESKGMFICTSNKNGGWQFSNMAWNYGAELEVEENGKWKANLDCNAAVEALSWLQKMKQDDLVYKGIAIAYDDWPSCIGERVGMAIVGSDILHLAKTTGYVDMEDLAFVPMPTGDGEHHYSLYGGTPFVFDEGTSDEQVRGILKFFDYIGRSPSTSETNIAAIKKGYEVARNKNQPILPKIMPWKNADYLEVAKNLEKQYVSVDMDYYAPFFDTVSQYKKSEEPIAAQKMYEILDDAIQSLFQNPSSSNPKSLLTTANGKLQKILDEIANG